MNLYLFDFFVFDFVVDVLGIPEVTLIDLSRFLIFVTLPMPTFFHGNNSVTFKEYLESFNRKTPGSISLEVFRSV